MPADYSKRTMICKSTTSYSAISHVLCKFGSVRPYSEIENGNQYGLTVICMLANYVFMVPIKTKTTEDIINACLKHEYSTFGGSKYILSGRNGEFSSKQFTWLNKELGFTKVYTSLMPQ